MPVKLQVSEVIDRPVADVFRFCALNHVHNHPRWDPDIRLEQVSDGPIGVGTLIHRRNTRSGSLVEGTMKIVEFEPNRSMKAVINEGPTEVHGGMAFQAQDPQRTRLTLSLESDDIDESMASLISGLMHRSAENIKHLVESEG